MTVRRLGNQPYKHAASPAAFNIPLHRWLLQQEAFKYLRMSPKVVTALALTGTIAAVDTVTAAAATMPVSAARSVSKIRPGSAQPLRIQLWDGNSAAGVLGDVGIPETPTNIDQVLEASGYLKFDPNPTELAGTYDTIPANLVEKYRIEIINLVHETRIRKAPSVVAAKRVPLPPIGSGADINSIQVAPTSEVATATPQPPPTIIPVTPATPTVQATLPVALIAPTPTTTPPSSAATQTITPTQAKRIARQTRRKAEAIARMARDQRSREKELHVRRVKALELAAAHAVASREEQHRATRLAAERHAVQAKAQVLAKRVARARASERAAAAQREIAIRHAAAVKTERLDRRRIALRHAEAVKSRRHATVIKDARRSRRRATALIRGALVALPKQRHTIYAEAKQAPDMAAQIYDYLVGNSVAPLTPIAATGVLGNMQSESSLNPERVELTPATAGLPGSLSYEDLPDWVLDDPSLGWGLVQSTPPSKMIDWILQAGGDPNNALWQVQWIASGLAGSQLLAQLNACQDAGEAAGLFESDFEKPYSESDIDQRGQQAQAFYNEVTPTTLPQGA